MYNLVMVKILQVTYTDEEYQPLERLFNALVKEVNNGKYTQQQKAELIRQLGLKDISSFHKFLVLIGLESFSKSLEILAKKAIANTNNNGSSNTVKKA